MSIRGMIFRTVLTTMLVTSLLTSANAQDCVSNVKTAADNYRIAAFNEQVATTAAADDPNNAIKASASAQATLARRLAYKALLDEYTLGPHPACIVAAILEGMHETAVARAKAIYQQNGASVGGGSSTNVVAKGTTANLLAIAQQYGALTESVSGQNVTVSGTLGGIPTLLVNSKVATACVNTKQSGCVSLDSLSGLNRLSYSIAFAATQPSPQVSVAGGSSTSPTTFTASSQTVNEVTVKAVILPGAAAQPAAITAAFNKLTTAPNLANTITAQQKLATELGGDLTCINAANPTAICKWRMDQVALIDQQIQAYLKMPLDSVPPQFDGLYSGWVASLAKTLCTDQTSCDTIRQDAADFANAAAVYNQQLRTIVDGLRHTELSAEYDANFPASQTSNSVIRVIATPSLLLPFGKKVPDDKKFKLDLTLNGAVSWNNGSPSTTVPGSRILRDFQLAGELSHTFGSATSSSSTLLGQSTVSAAYYYQDQTSPSILNVTPGQPVSGVTFTSLPSNASQVFAQRGVIQLVQGKFTFIPGKGSISVPIAFTWSNRTELVTQPIWRSQIGISYDFDSLFGKSSGSGN